MLFDLDKEELREIRQDLENTVSEAISEAIRRSMYSSTVTLRIDIDLKTTTDEDGAVVLVPEYEYKSGYRIGGKYDGKRSMTRSTMGLQMQGPGMYRQVQLSEQMSLVK
jgi:hypothetical protein